MPQWSRGRRLTLLWASAIALFAAIAAVAWHLWIGPGQGLQNLGAVAGIVSAAVAIAALVVQWVTTRPERRAGRDPDDSLILDHATNLLAKKVSQQWTDEIGVRRLRHPRPIRLHWESRKPGGRRGGVIGSGSLTERKGADPPATALFRAFRSLPARQLLVLGAPGAGKSTLAILFTIAAIEARNGEKTGGRSDPPTSVPVLLTISGWRPTEEKLRDWLGRRIAEDYPEVADTAAFGPDAPRRLVEAGRILPVLDGLDEMPAALIDEALRSLDELAGVGGLEFVVTCRRDEYEAAVKVAGRLSTASVITIGAISVEDSIEFLVGSDPDAKARWGEITKQMRDEPDAPVSRALSTPLMNSLARTVYAPTASTPTELSAFASAKEVEDHLLDEFLPTAYPKAKEREAARRSLIVLARMLRYGLQSVDLAWWRLAELVPRWVIVALTTVSIALLGGLIGAVLSPFWTSLPDNTVFGVGLGAALGFVAGMSTSRTIGASLQRGSFRSLVMGVTAAALRDGLAAAVIVGLDAYARLALSYGSLAVTLSDLPFLASSAAFGGIGGLCIGLVTNSLRAGRAATPRRPLARLQTLVPRLLAGLGIGLVAAIPPAVGVGIAAGIGLDGFSFAGLRTGLWTLFAVGFGLGIPIGVGRWLRVPVDDSHALSPRSVYQADAYAASTVAIIPAFVTGLAVVFVVPIANLVNPAGSQPIDGFGFGVLCCAVVFATIVLGSGSSFASWEMAQIGLALSGWLPGDLLSFLERAHEIGVLRQVGPVYQFRHARLQERLSEWPVVTGKLRPWPRRAVAHWASLATPPVATTVETRDSLSSRRHRIRRIAATTVAILTLLSLVATITVPVIRNKLALLRNGAASRLIADADAIQASRPEDALQLRIAAAEIDSSDRSTVELGRFLLMMSAPPVSFMHTDALDYAYLTGSFFDALKSSGGQHQLWDLKSSPARRIDVGPNVDAIELSEGSGWVVVDRADNTKQLWDLRSGTPHTVDTGADAESIEVYDDRWAIVTSETSPAQLWNLALAEPRPVDMGTDVADISMAGTDWAAITDSNESVTLRSLTAGPERQIDLGPGVNTVDTYTTGRFAVVARGYDDNERYDLLDIGVTPPRSLRTDLDDLSLSDDHAWAITYPTSGHAELWNLTTRPPTSIPLGTDVTSEGSDLEDRAALVAHRDGTTILWDLAHAKPRAIAVEHDVDMDYTTLLAGALILAHSNGPPELWDLGTTFHRIALASNALDISGDVNSQFALVRYDDGTHVLWDLDERPIQEVNLGQGVQNLDVSADARWAIAYHDDGSAQLWDLDRHLPFDLGPDVEYAGTWVTDRAAIVQHSGSLDIVDLTGSSLRTTVLASAHDYFDDLANRLAVVTHVSSNSTGGDLVVVWDLSTLAGAGPSAAVEDPHADACGLVRAPLDRREWQQVAPDVPYHDICQPTQDGR